MIYDDGRISCDDQGVQIRWYYLWGHKRIPYSSLESVTRRRLTWIHGKWRIWGSGDLRHYYNLDRTRVRKEWALELDIGNWSVPVITPDDPDQVERVLRAHLSRAAVDGAN